MPVPEDIRKVERPCNTVVQDSGREGPKRYIVRARKSVKYVAGGNPQPVNGSTVGYIIDHVFVPVKEKTASAGPEELSYGACALAKTVSDDIVKDLLSVFPPNDAYSIAALATLKVIRPKVSGSRMSSLYSSSFVSVFYPGAALSKNSVTSLYRKLGEDGTKREEFFIRRLSRVEADHHILIDGTLKQNTSRINDLSAYSYKARLKGCEDISVLYAYDQENMEPLCAKVFPGNSIDAVSYRAFIRDNHITKGIIVADKGFPPNNIRQELKDNEELHYITPVKRNDKRVSRQNLLSFEGVLSGLDHNVQFRKEKVSEGIYLYVFRDSDRACVEEKICLENMRKHNFYSHDAYEKKRDRFGLVIFESDLDLDPRAVYLAYKDRWKLEMVFKAYKSDDCLDRTQVQGDFSVYGSEFVNFISTLITCRIITKATEAGVFEEMTYGDMLEDLNACWRKTDVPTDVLPKVSDGFWVHTIPKAFDLLTRLGLCMEEPKPEEKPKGRKPGSKNKPKTKETEKKPVGRPRKNPPKDPNTPKRPVGRPRKNPLPDPDAPKRGVGRPRKKPLPDPDTPKRPVGRPRKNVDA